MAKFKVDKDARYAQTHEWVRVEDGVAVVGVSDFAQDSLSDVVFVDLPDVGDTITAGTAAATVESVKAAEDVIAPISGEVIEINTALQDTPEIVNERPYDAWFFRVQPSNLEGDLARLLDVAAYEKFVAESAH
jgi:glycine cleavage system H protein